MRREAVLAGYPEARLRLMPYFIPEREAETAPEQAPRRLLFVGRFIRHKGIDLMLRALVPVFERLPDVALDVVGEGLDYPELQAARALLDARGLAQRVTWHGWKTAGEIQALYDRCTLTIFPSVYAEAFGIVGIESQMAGRPVVAFDVGGVSDWLRDGENGLLPKAGDVEAMTAAVTALLEEPALYARLAEGAARSVRERFVAPAVVPQMIAEYRACLAEAAPQ
jgi:glycosyltransferase involved in cell wall biosynthesis